LASYLSRVLWLSTARCCPPHSGANCPPSPTADRAASFDNTLCLHRSPRTTQNKTAKPKPLTLGSCGDFSADHIEMRTRFQQHRTWRLLPESQLPAARVENGDGVRSNMCHETCSLASGTRQWSRVKHSLTVKRMRALGRSENAVIRVQSEAAGRSLRTVERRAASISSRRYQNRGVLALSLLLCALPSVVNVQWDRAQPFEGRAQGGWLLTITGAFSDAATYKCKFTPLETAGAPIVSDAFSPDAANAKVVCTTPEWVYAAQRTRLSVLNVASSEAPIAGPGGTAEIITYVMIPSSAVPLPAAILLALRARMSHSIRLSSHCNHMLSDDIHDIMT